MSCIDASLFRENNSRLSCIIVVVLFLYLSLDLDNLIYLLHVGGFDTDMSQLIVILLLLSLSKRTVRSEVKTILHEVKWLIISV